MHVSLSRRASTIKHDQKLFTYRWLNLAANNVFAEVSHVFVIHTDLQHGNHEIRYCLRLGMHHHKHNITCVTSINLHPMKAQFSNQTYHKGEFTEQFKSLGVICQFRIHRHWFCCSPAIHAQRNIRRNGKHSTHKNIHACIHTTHIYCTYSSQNDIQAKNTSNTTLLGAQVDFMRGCLLRAFKFISKRSEQFL